MVQVQIPMKKGALRPGAEKLSDGFWDAGDINITGDVVLTEQIIRDTLAAKGAG